MTPIAASEGESRARAAARAIAHSRGTASPITPGDDAAAAAVLALLEGRGDLLTVARVGQLHARWLLALADDPKLDLDLMDTAGCLEDAARFRVGTWLRNRAIELERNIADLPSCTQPPQSRWAA